VLNRSQEIRDSVPISLEQQSKTTSRHSSRERNLGRLAIIDRVQSAAAFFYSHSLARAGRHTELSGNLVNPISSPTSIAEPTYDSR
jgi:hypothetical protein